VRFPVRPLVLGRAVRGRHAAATVLEPVLLETCGAAVRALATELTIATDLDRLWKSLLRRKEDPSFSLLRVLLDASSEVVGTAKEVLRSSIALVGCQAIVPNRLSFVLGYSNAIVETNTEVVLRSSIPLVRCHAVVSHGFAFVLGYPRAILKTNTEGYLRIGVALIRRDVIIERSFALVLG
jgi:hypothetical protein